MSRPCIYCDQITHRALDDRYRGPGDKAFHVLTHLREVIPCRNPQGKKEVDARLEIAKS